MAADRRSGRLSPESIARLTFPTSFRGFDPDYVRAFLEEVADALTVADERIAQLQEALERGGSAADIQVAGKAAGEGTGAGPAPMFSVDMDEAALTLALGEETARVLLTARQAASDIRAKAEQSVAGMLRDAQTAADQARADVQRHVESERARAEQLVANSTVEARQRAEGLVAAAQTQADGLLAAAQAQADSLLAAAKTQADGLLAAAQQQADEARAAAAADRLAAAGELEWARAAALEAVEEELESAREEGRMLIAEAQVVRDRVLRDLARRRKQLRVQLEQLQTGRERLLEAYEVVRRTSDEATRELQQSLGEARVLAETAGRRAEDEPEPAIESLIAEVEAARLAGLTGDAARAIVEAQAAAGDPESDADDPAGTATAAAAPPPAGVPLPPLPSTGRAGRRPPVTRQPPPMQAPQPVPPRPASFDVPSFTIISSPRIAANRAGDEAPAEAPASPAPDAPANAVTEVGAAGDLVALPPLPERIPPAPSTPEPFLPPRKARRRRGDPGLPEAELVPLPPPDPVEGMRVITGEVPAVPVSAAPPIGAEAPPEAPPEPVAAPPQVETQPVPVVEPPAAPEHAEEPAAMPVEEAGAESASADVGAVFARLRAEREGKVAHAEAVLAAPPPAPTEPADDAEPTGAAVEPTPGDTTGAHVEPAAEPAPTAEREPAIEAAPAGNAEPASDTAPAAEAAASAEGGSAPPNDATEEAAADAALLARRDDIVSEIDARLLRRLKRVLTDEQNEVLDRLRRARGTSPAEVLLEESSQLARWEAAALDQLDEAASGGAEFLGHGSDGGPVADLARHLATLLVGPLRDRVVAALEEADGDQDRAAERVRACYREWKTARVAEVSRHSIVAAFGRGSLASAPEGCRMRWVVDGTPCPDAEDNALAGPVAKGDEYPTGHLAPPAHPGCRCLLALVSDPA